jgi:heme-degrading monooxygenase HmoA
MPWKSYSTAAPEREYAALLSYLPLKRAWRLPWLVLQSFRIQRQLRASRGLIGYSLRAQLTGKRFWTLSAWEDEAALQQFVRARPHVEIMTALAPHMGKTSFVRWKVKGFELPLDWDEALKRG